MSGPSGETFAGTGAIEWYQSGHGMDFPPDECPVKGNPMGCCTYSFSRAPCEVALRVIHPPAPPKRRSWLARLLRWRR